MGWGERVRFRGKGLKSVSLIVQKICNKSRRKQNTCPGSIVDVVGVVVVIDVDVNVGKKTVIVTSITQKQKKTTT